MIEKNNINKVLRSILRRQAGLPDHLLMHPYREWLICLSITTILLTTMVIFCVRLYQHYATLVPGQSVTNDTGSTSIIYRSEEVATSLENFTVRKNTHDQIRQTLTETANSITLPVAQTSEATTTSTSTLEIAIEPATEATTPPVPTAPEIVAPEPLPVTEAI